MQRPTEFDTSTRCADRTPDEIWLPYDRLEDRLERDLIYGRSPEEFERSLGIPAELNDLEYIPRIWLFELYDALRFANYSGFVFNVEVTINWQKAGLKHPSQIDRSFQKLTDRYRKYASQRKIPILYYAVFENGRYMGYHSHMSFHVPDCRHGEFSKWLEQTLKEGFDGISLTKFYKPKFNRNNNVLGQWLWFQYCMKGVNPRLQKGEFPREDGKNTVHELMMMRFGPIPAGVVEIDRVRVSRSLRAKAQRAAGYVVPEDVCDVSPYLLWSDSEYRRGIADRQFEQLRRQRYEVIL
ncbi:hypothetical protein ACFQ4O_01885 [Methylopila musalis]|uniref:Replication initiation protein n=1 Tax=Methylopila musalis TaxID=1134781 RepID=A0ABW3Z3I8_9HYPH